MQKMVNGEVVDMTEQEVAEWQAMQSLQNNSRHVPQSVTPRQARLALLQSGLLDDVESVIAEMVGDGGRAARIEWEYSTEVLRSSPMISGVQISIGMTDEQIDDLFIMAAEL